MAGAAAVGSNQYGLDAQLFTRGTGDDRDRGGSMVQKHQEKLQEEKENLAIQKMAALMPNVAGPVRVLALKEAVYDIDTALSILRAFQTQNDDALKAIQKKRKKLALDEEEAVAKAEADEAAASSSSEESSSGSSDDDSSSGSDSDSRRKSKDRKRSSSKRKRSSSKKGKQSGKKGSKHSSSSGKKAKKAKHSKGKRRSKRGADTDSDDLDAALVKPKSLTASDNYGRFGIIRETDAMAKRTEFTLWAQEVRKVDIEMLSKTDERELFKDFIEDYNTGTMTHRKYYNAELYERQKAAKEAAKSGGKPDKKPRVSVVDDEKAMRQAREEERQRLAAERLQQAYTELQATDKARDMREQDMLRQQMQAAFKVGDTKTAHLIQKRLMTDDEKIAKGIIKPPRRP